MVSCILRATRKGGKETRKRRMRNANFAVQLKIDLS